MIGMDLAQQIRIGCSGWPYRHWWDAFSGRAAAVAPPSALGSCRPSQRSKTTITPMAAPGHLALTPEIERFRTQFERLSAEGDALVAPLNEAQFTWQDRKSVV